MHVSVYMQLHNMYSMSHVTCVHVYMYIQNAHVQYMYIVYLQQSDAQKEQVCVAAKLVKQEPWQECQQVVLGSAERATFS